MKYKFVKECISIDSADVLNNFENNFKRTECYHKIVKENNSLDLNNDYFDYNYSYKLTSPWNLWKGIGNMNILILPNKSENSFLVLFSISIKRQIAFFIMVNIFFCIIISSTFSLGLFYFLMLYNILSIVVNLERYFRHKNFFKRTIKIGDFYKYQVIGSKSYDWELILKRKSNSEIMEIIQRRTHLPDLVIELAKKELKNRSENS
jgi:hypothetical protein